MKFMKRQILIVSLVASFQIESSLAGDSWTVGVAAQKADGPYFETKTSAAPIIEYETDRLKLSTLEGASYRLFGMPDKEESKANISLLFSPRFAPNFGDHPIYRGLERKHGLDIGVGANFQFGSAALEFNGLFDISDTSKGMEITAKVAYQLRSLPVEFALGARYRNDNLNQYLFGVSQSELNDDRSAYSADESVTGFISAMAAVPLARNLVGYGKISYEDFGEVSDSPLVDTDQTTEFILGVIYQWN